MKFGESFPSPKIEGSEEIRKRVVSLRETDNPYEDSIHDLIAVEEKHREELKQDGFTGVEILNKYGDKHSSVVLEKIEAEKKKWIDELTGLRNRNAFNAETPQILSLESRSRHECAMIMLDFDHFKKVNDEYGHDAGDQALRQLAQIIRDSVRSSDFVYRYGGEEFVIFLPDTDSEKGKIVAEKIRASAENAEIYVNVGQNEIVLHKTISIGIVDSDQLDAWKNAGEHDFELMRDEMLKKADSVMYDAKNQGRNRVVVFSADEQMLEAA